ncbi:anthranilate phosphoribosyltransferase [Clostridium oryzae]|uniref:Anthranilate phosphoribosyltransferase n=1 Tax=Clostridium oryzae TaxID=1450648 RepID=A0A1V4IY66_9CLOT|nr:anthranilate phosphoribosyltransferase [Clostridium oryzae]OPJ64886.1 anthranilate phosphoribosyltransferase [Clostridium oryzae]
MILESLNRVMLGENLTLEQAENCMDEIMSGKCTNAQIAAFLTAMRMKRETIDEITGCAVAMKGKAEPFKILAEGGDDYAIDTCGTGGDGGRTFNISTAAAIVAAAAGVKVAKHGNRAVSSKSGSADVLKELGFNIELSVAASEKCLNQTGMTFLFAQSYHKAMKYAGPVRKELGVRTLFNILGPLTNPADIKGQVLGVYSPELVHSVAEVLNKLGRERAMVLHGSDGLDEITLTGTTKVSEVKNGRVIDYEIDPREYGMKLVNMEAIGGGTPEENAKTIKFILAGEKSAKRDIVVLNSAAAIYAGKKADSYAEGIKIAESILDSGKALEKLNEIVAFNGGEHK